LKRRQKIALASVIISIAAGVISVFAFIGSTLNLPQALTLYATGFGGGVSLVMLVYTKRPPKA
jgi:hypothetical protein